MAGFSLFGPQIPSFDWTQYAQPQRQLSIEDLYTPYQLPQLPQPPEAIQAFSGLDAARQKELRRQALLMAAGAIGQGLSTGRVGDALTQAALQDSQNRQGAIGEANQAQQQEFLRQRQIAEGTLAQRRFEAEDAMKRREAEGALGLVSRIAEQEPDLAGQAEALARAGDFAALQKLAADIPRRAQMRQYGVSPDDPFADERIKGLLSNQDKRAYEEWAKQGGYDRYFQKPEDPLEVRVEEARALAEAQAAAYAKYRQPAGGGDDDPRFYQSDGRIFEVVTDAAGNTTLKPVVDRSERERWQVIPANPVTGTPAYLIDVYTGATKSIAPPSPARAPEAGGPAPDLKRGDGKKPVPPVKPKAAVSQGEIDKTRKRQAELRGGIEKVRAATGGALPPEKEKAVLTLLRQGVTPDEIIKRLKAAGR